MSLFPRNSKYSDSDARWLLSMMESSYNEAITINQVYWAEGDIDSRFEAGDQSAWNEYYSHLPVNQRKQFNFNRIRRIKNMISGHQRKHRKSIVAEPIENGDEMTADQFTKIFMWLNKKESILETISDAFDSALTTGLSFIQLWMDYRNDPINGDIKINNCAYNSFLVDPFFRKTDLSDCNYLWKRSYLTRAECISLLPDMEEEIMSLNGSDKDGKFQYMPENYAYKDNCLLTYDEFYYRTYRRQKMLVDTQTGETLEWKSKNNDSLREFLSQYPQIDVVDATVPTVNLGIIVQGKVMYNDREPMGLDTYPFIPIVAYYNPDLPSYHLRLQGIVRGLRDAQFLYNRRKVIELDMLESQINSGLIVKDGALVDPNSAHQTGQGRVLFLKKGAEISDVQPIAPPQVPPSTIELSRLLGEEMQQISGVSDELLGAADDDKAGILSMLRQGAALTTLEGLFDNLDNSQKLIGRMILKLVQNNFTPGKVKNIIEQDPSEQFYNKFFGKYDCAIVAGQNTDTQRQMALSQGLQLRNAGIAIPDEFFIENLSIQNKTELKQMLQQQQQQAQQAQQMQQQAQMELIQAQKQEQEALANERNTRSAANIGLAEERRWEAYSNLEDAQLSKIKALSELEKLDIDKLNQLIVILNAIKQDSQEEVNQTGLNSDQMQARSSSSGLQKQMPQEQMPGS